MLVKENKKGNLFCGVVYSGHGAYCGRSVVADVESKAKIGFSERIKTKQTLAIHADLQTQI